MLHIGPLKGLVAATQTTGKELTYCCNASTCFFTGALIIMHWFCNCSCNNAEWLQVCSHSLFKMAFLFVRYICSSGQEICSSLARMGLSTTLLMVTGETRKSNVQQNKEVNSSKNHAIILKAAKAVFKYWMVNNYLKGSEGGNCSKHVL